MKRILGTDIGGGSGVCLAAAAMAEVVPGAALTPASPQGARSLPPSGAPPPAPSGANGKEVIANETGAIGGVSDMQGDRESSAPALSAEEIDQFIRRWSLEQDAAELLRSIRSPGVQRDVVASFSPPEEVRDMRGVLKSFIRRQTRKLQSQLPDENGAGKSRRNAKAKRASTPVGLAGVTYAVRGGRGAAAAPVGARTVPSADKSRTTAPSIGIDSEMAAPVRRTSAQAPVGAGRAASTSQGASTATSAAVREGTSRPLGSATGGISVESSGNASGSQTGVRLRAQRSQPIGALPRGPGPIAGSRSGSISEPGASAIGAGNGCREGAGGPDREREVAVSSLAKLSQSSSASRNTTEVAPSPSLNEFLKRWGFDDDEVVAATLRDLQPEARSIVLEGFDPKPGTKHLDAKLLAYARSVCGSDREGAAPGRGGHIGGGGRRRDPHDRRAGGSGTEDNVDVRLAGRNGHRSRKADGGGGFGGAVGGGAGIGGSALGPGARSHGEGDKGSKGHRRVHPNRVGASARMPANTGNVARHRVGEGSTTIGAWQPALRPETTAAILPPGLANGSS